jgi:hypothetical protein
VPSQLSLIPAVVPLHEVGFDLCYFPEPDPSEGKLTKPSA